MNYSEWQPWVKLHLSIRMTFFKLVMQCGIREMKNGERREWNEEKCICSYNVGHSHHKKIHSFELVERDCRNFCWRWLQELISHFLVLCPTQLRISQSFLLEMKSSHWIYNLDETLTLQTKNIKCWTSCFQQKINYCSICWYKCLSHNFKQISGPRKTYKIGST